MKRYKLHKNPEEITEIQFILDYENDSKQRAGELLELCYWGNLPLGSAFWEMQYIHLYKGNDLDQEAYIVLTELLRMETEDVNMVPDRVTG
jgi:hypothetical protein